MMINGTTVVDATHKIVLEISPADIKKGNNKDPGACAAAQACVRQIPGVEAARVHIARTYLKVKNKESGRAQWVRFRTPPPLRNEIIAFDRGGKFAPGAYTLEKIQETAKIGLKRKRYDGKNASKGKRHGKPQGKRSAPHRVTDIRARGANK